MRRAACLLAIVFAFTACNIGAEITVKDDGSGTFGVSMLLAKQDIAMLASFPGAKGIDPIDSMKKSLESSTVHMSVEEFQQDGGRGIRGTIPFTNVDQLRTEIAAMNRTQGGGPLGGNGTFKDFNLNKTPTGWHFDSQQDAPKVPGVNSKQSSSAGGSAGQFGQLFLNAIQLQFTVTLPGQTVSTNATQTQAAGDSTKFIWIPDLHKPAAMHLVADTKLGTSKFPAIPVGVGGGIAVIILIAALVAANKRKAAPAMTAPEHQITEPIVPPAPSYTQEPPAPQGPPTI
ncbi:MAG: hypothetical protein ACYDCC_03310 [Actinomycetota bacterium]